MAFYHDDYTGREVRYSGFKSFGDYMSACDEAGYLSIDSFEEWFEYFWEEFHDRPFGQDEIFFDQVPERAMMFLEWYAGYYDGEPFDNIWWVCTTTRNDEVCFYLTCSVDMLPNDIIETPAIPYYDWRNPDAWEETVSFIVDELFPHILIDLERRGEGEWAMDFAEYLGSTQPTMDIDINYRSVYDSAVHGVEFQDLFA